MVRKCFWLEQSTLMPNVGWSNIRDYFNRLEDSSNYSASVLQTNVAKNTSSTAERGYWKSNAIRITTILSSTLWWPLYPFFSCCSTLYRLEVIPRCCNDLSYIFILITTAKHPKQNKWFDKKWNQLSMLPSTMTPLYDAFACAFGLWCSFFQLLSKMTHSFAYKTNRMVAGVLQSIETIMHAWSVSASSQSALFKSKTFSYHMVVLQ